LGDSDLWMIFRLINWHNPLAAANCLRNLVLPTAKREDILLRKTSSPAAR